MFEDIFIIVPASVYQTRLHGFFLLWIENSDFPDYQHIFDAFQFGIYIKYNLVIYYVQRIYPIVGFLCIRIRGLLQMNGDFLFINIDFDAQDKLTFQPMFFCCFWHCMPAKLHTGHPAPWFGSYMKSISQAKVGSQEPQPQTRMVGEL